MWDKIFRVVGGLLYTGAAAVAGGAVPVSSHYAWLPAALGFILRTYGDLLKPSDPPATQ